MKTASQLVEVQPMDWSSQRVYVNALGVEGTKRRINEALPAPRLPQRIQDNEYRRTWMESHIEQTVAWQLRVNREARGLTQKEFAARMGTKQSAVSRFEDPDGADLRVSTLMRAAHAFDCALLIRFVSYKAFATVVSDVRPERLYVEPFGAEEQPSVWREAIADE